MSRPNWFRRKSMYLCTAQWIDDQSTHTHFFSWSIVNRSYSWRAHTHTHIGKAKEIPREHDRKNKMRLLANKSDIKNVWARRQPWPCYTLKITMKWLVFHGKTFCSTKVTAITTKTATQQQRQQDKQRRKKLGPIEQKRQQKQLFIII